MGLKFAVINLGCKVNRVESDAFVNALLARGFAQVESAQDANVVVVNTCTVTAQADKKTRKAVRGALRANGFSKVVVTGCACALNPESFTAFAPKRVLVAGKAQVLEVIEKLMCESEGDASNTTQVCGAQGKSCKNNACNTGRLALPKLLRSRVGVKVQDGCNNACSYCIVHVARGPATSKPASKVINECVNFARAGAREIVLTGINLGSYADASRGHNYSLPGILADLLGATKGICGPAPDMACRFRISSVEPGDVSDELIELMAKHKGRICRHMHLPLQSGSSRVLAEMNRNYTAQEFCELVQHIYEVVPEMALTTDIICGFPGERDADFESMLAVARKCRFSKIHAFPYSKREGTPAAARTDQVSAATINARAKQLRELANSLRAQDFAARAGTQEFAIVEVQGTARTESYYKVPVDKQARIGSLVKVQL